MGLFQGSGPLPKNPWPTTFPLGFQCCKMTFIPLHQLGFFKSNLGLDNS